MCDMYKYGLTPCVFFSDGGAGGITYSRSWIDNLASLCKEQEIAATLIAIFFDEVVVECIIPHFIKCFPVCWRHVILLKEQLFKFAHQIIEGLQMN